MDPVIVAGAGPVGLTLALALARHDIPTVVLAPDGDVPPDGPRTVVLRPDTVALLCRLGYPHAADDGCTWTSWRTLSRHQELLRVDFAPSPSPSSAPSPCPDLDAPPSPLHLAQYRLQRGLWAAATANPLVQLIPGCRLHTLEQDNHGITAHTRGDGQTSLRGSFLAGCDGPRSTARKLLGVRFPGRTAVDRYAVAILRVKLPFPGEARLHRNPPSPGRGARREREVTARPLPDGLWRLDWLLPPGSRTELLTPDLMIAKIRDILTVWCGDVPAYDFLGSAEYLVHQRLARRWRVGRAFLAGDSAHLLGTLGTQSVDEGLRDADNLAWKLALACHQPTRGALHLPGGLLDSYQAERRTAIGSRLRAADQALPLVRRSGVRRSILSGGVHKNAALLSDGNLGTGRLGAPPVYRASPLTPAPGGNKLATATTSTPAGAPVDDVPVTTLDGTRTQLRRRLGRNLLILLVAPGTDVWESKHWLKAGLMPPLIEATSALPLPAELVVTEAYPGAAAHAVLVIRPDGHLVAALTGCHPAELHEAAELIGGG